MRGSHSHHLQGRGSRVPRLLSLMCVLVLGLLATKASAQTSDFGDYSGFGNASSTVVTSLRIGATTDKESSATTNATATGDDTTGSDDEDGVTIPATVMRGVASSMTVNVTNSSGFTAYLNVWIDYNRNGVLTDSGEQVATNVTISNGANNLNRTVNFTPPAGASLGAAGVRVRLTSSSSPGATSVSGNGEVEDYLVTIQSNTDFGDYPSFASASQVANSVIRIGTNATDTEASNPSTGAATADDNDGVNDEDLTMPSFTAGVSTTLPIPVTVTTGSLSGSTARLRVFVDWNGDNDVADTNETLSAQTVNASGTYNFTLTPPANTTAGTKYLRIRITEGSTAPNFSGASTLKGEVEDYAIVVANTDFGDYAPFPSASSTTNSTLRIGSTVDGELAATTNSTATGDDATNLDDEDGVTVPASVALGVASSLTVNLSNSSGSTAYLNVWIDFNGNGVLTDSGEQVASNTTISNGTSNSNRTVNFTVPSLVDPGVVGVRVRLTSTSSPGSDGHDGIGEVEDYIMTLACPAISVSPTTLTTPTVGTAYSQTFTQSGGIGAVTWAVSSGTLPAWATLNPSTGVISGVPDSAATASFIIRATAGNDCTGTRAYSLTPACPAISVTPTSAANGVLGSLYNQTLSATGGTPAYTWTITSGTLPSGLSLGAAGVISGTPTSSNGSGTSVTVRATDAYGCFKNQAISIKICPLVSVNPGSLPTPTVGSAFSSTLSASGGASPYTFAITSGTLPSGLSLSSSTGVLSGTPTSTASQTFTVRATDANGCIGTDDYTLTPVCPVISVTPTTLTAGKVGTSYSQTLSAAGGKTPYSAWTIISGTLPTGLSLNTSSGVINGTPTAAASPSTSFTVRVNDSYGCQGTQVISLQICPAVTVSPTSLTNGTVALAYSQTVSAAGGAEPYVFAISSGSLPSGLTLNSSSGEISGTPTSPATASFIVRATDANNCSATRAYSVTPAPITDFGDYSGFASVSNIVNSSLRLGASSDAEASQTANSSATGDDTTGTDDENGVTMPASITAGGQITLPVTVTNNTGAPAYLNAWIDYNDNDVVTDAGEQIATNILIDDGTTAEVQNLSFTVPTNASVGSGRGVRFRLTSATSPGSTGAGTTGEVEDYVVSITAPTLDYGDFNLFPSASSVGNSNLRLGSSVDVEGAAVTNATATGDDTTGSDDENGVTVPATITQGSSGSLSANVTNSTGSTAYLNAWIDFNGNGVLTDAGEQIAINTTVNSGVSNSNRTINFTTPDVVKAGTVGVRVRLTSVSSPGPDGTDGTGEVEDYTTSIIVNTDFGDYAPFPSASSKVNSNLRIGALTDSEGGPVMNGGATGDDLDGSDDEDGVTISSVIERGEATSLTVNLTNTSGSTAFLNVWIDFNRNGVLTDAGEQIASNTTISNNTTNSNRVINFTTPVTAPLGDTAVRVRLTSVSSPGPDGLDGNGEVEDHLTTIVLPTKDYGDDSDFADASSVMNSNLRLGTLVDAEGAATKNTSASGDDNTGLDDEDSVFFPPLTAGQPVTMPVLVTNLTDAPAYLNAWIDFNNNGVLTNAGEQVASNIEIPPGTDGEVEISFNVPTNAVTAAASVGSRFRLTSTSSPGPTGLSGIGEVEDHQVIILAPLTDFGDFSGAPNVSNTATTNLRLGALVDTEYAATTNATATGDDISGVDDEDGATIPAMTAGGPATIVANVTNTSGAPGYLNVWVDFNNNGSFDDSGEQVMINGGIANGTNSSNVNVAFTVPAGAVTGVPLGVRVRITSDISPGSFGAGGLGEVEDYVVTIAVPTTDFGDFSGFADASSLRNSSLRLGALTDTEFFSTRNSTATGDDITGSDDEDGVTFSAMTTGAPATVPVQVTNNTGSTAYLNAWIDYNNNGVLTDAGEQIATNVAITTGTSNVTQNLNFTVAPAALTGVSLGARVRLTSTSSPGPIGASGNGEVEDYIVNLVAPTTDFGDFSGFGDASQGVNPVLRMGELLDAEFASTRNATATGDDTTGIDDEDGVVLPVMTAGQSVVIPVTVTNLTGAVGYLNVWFDFNGNGVLTDSGEQIATNLIVVTGTADGLVNLPVTVPATAVTGTPVGLRFRYSAPSGLGPTGSNPLAGEVEDYVITIAAPTTDFGDFSGFADASSIRNSNLRLGALTDTEFISTRNAAATGDDSVGSDDEDAVTIPSMTAGAPTTIPVLVTNNSGSTAYLNAWIDYNNNGILTDSGEQIATNVAISTGTTNATQNLGFTVSPTAVTGTNLGVRFRLTSTSSPGPIGASGNGEVEDYIVSLLSPTTDFGDFNRFGSASNAVNNNLRLGALVDAEFSATTNAAATGDDVTGSDDEDGVTLPPMIAGQTLSIPVVVTNLTGANAYLNVWIDFNNDGLLTGAGEQVASNVAVGTGNSGITANLNVTVPASAVTGTPIGVRVRLTSVTTPGPTSTLASIGEVEDYTLTISAPTTDFGDFTSFGDASSTVISSIKLGALTDTEYLSTRNVTATGDDTTGSDDEDAAVIPAMTAGAPVTASVMVTNTSGSPAYLNAWIDYNNNGILTDSGEQVATNVVIATGASNSSRDISYTVPATAVTGTNLGIRFRLTSTSSPGPLGASGNGEVEDYVASISMPPLDYGDHSSLASASSTANTSLRLGASVDTEFVPTLNAVAAGDDTIGSDDEDGVTINPMTAGAPASIVVTATNVTASSAYLNAWIDFNNDSDFLDAGEQLATNVVVVSGVNDGIFPLNFTVPANAVTGANVALRFRLTSTIDPGVSGNSGIGEVEDYVSTIAVPTTDFGDWSGAGDAWSIASSNLRMGALADTEYVSTRNATATGDDTVGSDDEEGVTMSAGYNLGSNSSLTVLTTNLTGTPAYLNAWVDWNNNGSFSDPGEQISTNVSIPSGTTASMQTVNFTVPLNAVPGGRGARFRLTDVQNPTPLGAAGMGEVEDYLLNVFCPTISVGPASLTTPTVGAPYSATATVSGGTAPHAFTVSNGSLPAGLSLNASTGVISGTPTSSASQTFTIRAADLHNCLGTRTYTLVPLCTTISITPTTAASGMVGAAYSQTLSATGGTAPYSAWTVTSGTLPTGLTLNATTGLISGTPTASASPATNITVRVNDTYGCQGTQIISLKICPVVTLSPTTLAAATVGTAYSQTISGTGGATPYTFALSSGSLPAWATLNAGTGVISGLPNNTTTAGFIIRATDANGCSGTRAYSITPACPAIAVTPTVPAVGTVGTAYSQTMVASGGSPAYTWTTVSGAWPAGLSLGTTGVISGTPTAANGAGSSITVRATDAYGCFKEQAVSLKICPVIELSPTSFVNGSVGTAYSQTISASGSATAYTYTVSSGSLPAWATLNAISGVISGTPNNTTSTSFTIRATDANGCIGTRSFSISPACPAITIIPETAASARVGVAYSQTLTASGGTAAYTWTTVSGAWPSGLSMSSAGVISGTPQADTAHPVSVTVRATDIYGCSSTQEVSIVVCPVITPSPSTLPNGTVGSPYSQIITALTGVEPHTFSISAGSLPAGLTIDSLTGIISGTPTSSANAVFTVRVTDLLGCIGTRSYSVTPVCPTISLNPTSLANGVVGTAYSQTVSASGSTGPYTFAVSAGSLPAWASLNTTTGAITGTPNSTTSSTFTLRATDVYGCTGTRSYTIAPVCPTITITTSAITAYLGTGFSQSLAASGGTAPYSAWTVTSGTMPAGLTLNSSGLITGTPTVIGSSAVTVRANDLYGCQGSRSITITVKGLTVGNLVWQDNNNNGFVDAGEPGVSGVQVQLMNPGADNVIGGSSADVQVDSLVTTPASGAFSFTNLPPGNYYLRLVAPAAFTHTSGTPATTDNSVNNNNDGSQPGGPGTPVFSPVFNLTPGAESITDGDTDPDTNLTMDFGLWAPLGVGNLVFIDLNGSGTFSFNEGIEGAYVYIFPQGANPATDEPVGVGYTDHKGRYFIDGLNPGSYFLHLPAFQFAANALLAGMIPITSVVAGDDDSGQDLLSASTPATTGASTAVFTLAPGAEPTGSAESGYEGFVDDAFIDSNNDFTLDLGLRSPSGTGYPLAQRERNTVIVTESIEAGVELPESTTSAGQTFTAWSELHSGEEDGDLYPNLLEYALDTDPADGRSGAGEIRMETTVLGAADVVFTRPANGRADIRYDLETSTDATTWTRFSLPPGLSISGDGRQLVRYAGVDAATLGPRALFRLKVALDSNLDGAAEQTATSPTVMFSRETFPVGQRTLSMPLVQAELYAGAITQEDLTVILPQAITPPAGARLYLEDLATGSTHEIDESASTSTRLKLEAGTAAPALTRIALRIHHTLGSLLPADLLTAGDRVLTFDAGANGFTSIDLTSTGWSSDPVLPKNGGVLVHLRSSEATLLFTGQVGQKLVIIPASATRLMGSASVVTESALSLGLTSENNFRAAIDPASATRLRLWKADTDPAQTGYDQLYLSPIMWLREIDTTAQNLTEEKLIEPFRAFFLVP